MRPRHRADDIERILDIGDPVAQRLVHGVLERRRARDHRPDLRAEKLACGRHWGFCRSISVCAHIDDARQPEARGHRGHGHAVLARARFRDNAGLAHALGQQDLAEAVVDLVRAGVVQLVALEVDFRAAETLGQPLGVIERAGRPA